MTLKTLAIFGGTFDPVHNGHLQSALELKQRLSLDELRLLPCHRPPHRQSPGCSSQQRLEMLKLAVRDTPLQVDDREIKRDGLSYSVDTLEQLRLEVGPERSLIWVMGCDAFATLDSWHRWQSLLTLAHIVVLARPGAILPTQGAVADLMRQAQTDDAASLKQRAAGTIYRESLTPYPISATAIRRAIADQQIPEGYLPLPVLHYIKRHRLYR